MKKLYFKGILGLLLTSLIAVSILLARSDVYQDVSTSWKLIYEVYKRIVTHYSDQINSEKLAEAAIRGMLSKLDPYSVYMREEEKDNLDMLTKGEYGGVGIQLGVNDDSLTVIAPIEGSPAFRNGILPGDKIIAINNELTRYMDIEEAAKKIRGDKDTKVILTIVRFGELEPLEFELIRDIILVHDVSYAEMINSEIGYIRITRFSRNAPIEIRKAFLDLKEKQLKGVILDLRGNPGGLLDAAIQFLDTIFEKGVVLLSTMGQTKDSNRQFTSQSDPLLDASIPLIVLIDGGSASASEIIAGVIQDMDRGVVIGNKSFGKGLVQTVYALDKDRSIKLTTAKYYLPSGRPIQKPNYLDSLMLVQKMEVDSIYITQNGRKVTSNGGITPDITIEQEKVPILTRECWRKGLFFKFASMYSQNHKMSPPVVIDENILAEFQNYLSSKELDINSSGYKQFLKLKEHFDTTATESPKIQHSLNILSQFFEEETSNLLQKEKKHIMIGLEREFSSVMGGNKARIESSFDDDPYILKGLSLLSNRVSYNRTLNGKDI